MKLDFLPAKLSFKKYSFLKTSRPQVFRLDSQEDFIIDGFNQITLGGSFEIQFLAIF